MTLHVAAGEAPGLQRFFSGLEPHRPSHSPPEVEPWDGGDLVTEESHTTPENKEHFFWPTAEIWEA